MGFHVPFVKFLQDEGYEVHVAAKLSPRKKEYEDIGLICHNIDIVRSPFSLSNIKALFQLVNILKSNNYSLIHVHTPIGAFVGRLAAKITKCKPVLYTAHGFHFYIGAPFINWALYYPMEKLAARWTDGIITINEEDYSHAKKFKIREKSNIFKVHGVGIDIEKFLHKDTSSRNKLREQLLVDDDSVVCVCIGELNKNKNQIQLFEAVKILKKEGKKLVLLVVGEGNNKQNLIAYVDENGLNNNIKILGLRKDVPQILNISDIIALVSKREGLGRCLMEGMSAKLPIVATNTRGPRELVKDGVNGFLIPVGDVDETVEALRILIDDRELRKKMGDESYKIVKDFSLEKVIDEMDIIYKRFLNY